MDDETEDQGPFRINPHNLAGEWRKQPQLMRAAGRREADARHNHAQAKARLAVTAASLKLAMRKNPGKFDLRDKPNQDEIDCALELEKEYVRAVADVNRTKLELDYAEADTTAYVDRRKALENHVQLLSIEYYSEKEPKAHTPEARERADDLRRRSARESD